MPRSRRSAFPSSTFYLARELCLDRSPCPPKKFTLLYPFHILSLTLSILKPSSNIPTPINVRHILMNRLTYTHL